MTGVRLRGLSTDDIGVACGAATVITALSDVAISRCRTDGAAVAVVAVVAGVRVDLGPFGSPRSGQGRPDGVIANECSGARPE